MSNLRLKYIVLALLGLIVVVLSESLYTVQQYEQAIVIQFGEPVRVIKEPGLKIKIPFIQKVVYYDTRLLNLDPPAQEIVLGDKKRLDVDSFTRYQIIDPLKFYQTVRTEFQAQSKLEEIVNSSVRNVLGRITLKELLSEKRSQIMADISSAVKKDAAQIGVQVAEVRIRRADLPIEVLQAINDRMKAERERDAKEARAEGQQAAQQIRATADIPTGGWFQLPQGGDDLWLSNRAAFIPAGPAASDGFFFGGYDGAYNVNYYDGAEWSVAIPEAGNWGGGPQGMGTITWNGKKILAFIQMGYTWWSEGWGMPAYLWVVDVTNPKNPVVLSNAEYSNPSQIISGDTENSTVDVVPVVDGADLVVYLVDTSKGLMAKVKFPKL